MTTPPPAIPAGAPTAFVPRVTAPPIPAPPPPSLRPLRVLLWGYLALWVLEGALRKWIFPSLANPLLVVRDPVLLLIYALAFAKGVFPKNAFIVWIAGLGAATLALSIAATDAPLVVELYGLRTDYLHLPLIFVIPAIFHRDHIRAVGRWTLLIAGPMALLVLLQFGTGAGSRFNVGVGGGTNGMLDSAYGHIRPSGTFSFTNGLSGFTSLVAAFFLYHLLEKRVYPRVVWLVSGGSLLILIALSGSRSVVGIMGIIIVTVIVISIGQRRYWGSSLKLVALIGMVIVVLGSFAVFKQGLNVFAFRFGSAANVQKGFFGRFIETALVPFTMVDDVKLGGVGLGMGTNAAAGLMHGKRGFYVAEGEGPRIMLESGPVLGLAFVLLRLAIAIYLGCKALGSLRRDASTLPLLLFSGCFIDMVIGQFSQPTALGYVTIAGGLCLASARPGDIAPEPEADGGGVQPAAKRLPASAPAGTPPPRARGRSIYAAQLHDTDSD